jgi:hypothetical protein
VRGHPARPDASETLAYPGIARTGSVNDYIPATGNRKNRKKKHEEPVDFYMVFLKC